MKLERMTKAQLIEKLKTGKISWVRVLEKCEYKKEASALRNELDKFREMLKEVLIEAMKER